MTHVGSMRLVGPYVDAVRREIISGRGSESVGPLETVYLGGGTPSVLTPGQVTSILHTAADVYGLEADAEITLEAHPKTVDRQKLQGFLDAGITRISFGAESLDPRILSPLGRGHGPETVLHVISEAHQVGFESVNADLIYGLPGQTMDSWTATVDALLEAGPEHVSLYPLQIEPRTVFGRRHREGNLSVPADADVVEMYHEACSRMRAAGYEHYEIANWALPGYESRHNLSYWLDSEYAAAGVGAHAYLHPFRTENLRGTRRYIDTVMSGASPIAASEFIDESTRLSERVVLGLRLLTRGLDLGALETEFGQMARHLIEEIARPLVIHGALHRVDSRLLLPEEYVPVANEILDRFVELDLPEPLSA